MADLAGQDFVAQVRLSDPQDRTLAEVGQTCERVPAASLPWLLADGRIVAVPRQPFTETPPSAALEADSAPVPPAEQE